MSRVDAVLEWSSSGIVAYSPATRELVRAASLRDAWERLGSPKHVGIALGRSCSIVKPVELPPADREELLTMVALQLGDFVPLPEDDVSFDLAPMDESGEDGKLYLLSATRTSTLRRLQTDLQGVSASVEWIAPAALGASAWADRRGLRDTCLISEAAEGAAIDVLHGGVPAASRIATPGADLQEEVARAFAVAETADLPVVQIDDDEDSPLAALVDSPIAASVAMLSPLERAQARRKQVKARMRFALLACVAAVAVGLFVFFNRSDEAAAAQAERESYTAELNKLSARLRQDKAERKRLTAMLDQMDRGFLPAQPADDVMTIVANSVPESFWLTSFNYERGKELTLRGTAKSDERVADFLQVLSATDRFRGTKLDYVNEATIGEAEVVHCSISTWITGNLPLEPIDSEERPQ